MEYKQASREELIELLKSCKTSVGRYEEIKRTLELEQELTAYLKEDLNKSESENAILRQQLANSKPNSKSVDEWNILVEELNSTKDELQVVKKSRDELMSELNGVSKDIERFEILERVPDDNKILMKTSMKFCEIYESIYEDVVDFLADMIDCISIEMTSLAKIGNDLTIIHDSKISSTLVSVVLELDGRIKPTKHDVIALINKHRTKCSNSKDIAKLNSSLVDIVNGGVSYINAKKSSLENFRAVRTKGALGDVVSRMIGSHDVYFKFLNIIHNDLGKLINRYWYVKDGSKIIIYNTDRPGSHYFDKIGNLEDVKFTKNKATVKFKNSIERNAYINKYKDFSGVIDSIRMLEC